MYERMNVKVDVPKLDERRPSVINKPITLEYTISWIKAQNYDVVVEQELIKKVSRYPHAAFTAFVRNIQNHINVINKARQKDMLAQKQAEALQKRDLGVEKSEQELLSSLEEEFENVPSQDDYEEDYQPLVQEDDDEEGKSEGISEGETS